jgi:L-fucose isomerase-like protein
MPLLTPLQTINARLADDARQCANHIASASAIANRMVAAMLSLDDEQLTAWLNSQPREDVEALLAAHGQLGEAINAAATVAQAVLNESGMSANIPPVDVRSVAEKLADQRRVLTYANGAFTVTALPPEP